MEKTKIKKLPELSSLVKKHKVKGKTVGLITGCFDILHIGHIKLFQEAKRCADIVVIGIDNDDSIRLTKGANRPVNNQNNRLCFLSILNCVDYVFLIENVFNFNDKKTATAIQETIYQTIVPNYLITNKKTDKYWKNKKKSLQKFGIKMIDTNQDMLGATTKI